MTPSDTAMHSTGLKTIYSEANQRVCGDIGLATILSTDDLAVVDARSRIILKNLMIATHSTHGIMLLPADAGS